MKVKAWLAASKRGQLKIFNTRPERDEILGIWVGDWSVAMMVFLTEMEVRGAELPQMTWNDNPLEVTVEINF